MEVKEVQRIQRLYAAVQELRETYNGHTEALFYAGYAAALKKILEENGGNNGLLH